MVSSMFHPQVKEGFIQSATPNLCFSTILAGLSNMGIIRAFLEY